MRENVEFVSNSADLPVLLQGMRESKTFVISPEFVEQGPENSYMLSSVTLFAAVLADKEKNLVIVARVLDDNGNLVKCQTNLGDVKVNKELPLDECRGVLADSTSVRVLVSLPDPGLSRVRVVVEENLVHIRPNSFESVSHSTFVFLEALYEDSGEIIDRVNTIVDLI